MALTFGSVFTGIAGIDLGLERAGMTCAWQVEIDKHCQFVLSRHFPHTPRHGDITTLKGGDLGSVDALVGGFPCQDVSLAGRRAGLAGKRSGLFFEFARLIDELAPRWVVIENVPGLLSSNGGRDMGAVLGTLAELGYGYAYRVLDAQYFGVPQRRRRVVIVGNSRDWTAPAAVLFESESVRGDSPPRRETGAGITSGAPRGATGGREGGADSARTLNTRTRIDQDTETFVVSTLQGGGKRGYRVDAESAGGGQLIPVARSSQR